MNRSRLVVAAVLTACALGSCLALPLAHGEDPAPLLVAGKTFAAADLPLVLEQLGYDSTPTTAGRLIVVDREGWALRMNLTLSADGGTLSVYVALRKADEVPKTALLELLRASFRRGPVRFYHDTQNHWIGAVGSRDNRDLRPADLRKLIDDVYAAIRAEEAAWDPEQWAKPAQAPPAAPGMGG